MKKSLWNKLLILLVITLFCLVSAVALAAEKQWYVLKDSKGVCKVVQLKEKTPKAIAGPFASKADAQKAKAEACPKAAPGKKEPAKKQ
ncbi:MAG: hypothetical protein ACP5M0_12140 [Desulfomonilaceae bacterium]